MEDREIIKTFSRNGFILRPGALDYISSILEKSSEEKKTLLKLIIEKIQKILLDKKKISDSIIDKELAEEAFILYNSTKTNLMEIEGDENKKDDDQETFKKSLIFIDNFAGLDLFKKDEKNYHLEKFDFLKKKLEKSQKYFFDHQKNRRKNKKSIVLSLIGNLKGQSGFFNIFGIIFSRKGKFFLQDTINEIKIKIDNCKNSNAYFYKGSVCILSGYIKNDIFDVENISYPNYDIEDDAVNKFFVYKEIFYDNLNKKNLVSRDYFRKFFNLSEVIDTNPSKLYFSVLSNFIVNDENLEKLEKILCDFFLNSPVALFIVGNFIEDSELNSETKREEFAKNLKKLENLLQKYNSIFKHTLLFLIPDILDFGMNTFPRKELSFSIFSEILSKIPNTYLAQNPCKFFFFGRTFNITRLNLINKALRTSIIPINQENQPFELLTETIINQKDLLPFNFPEYPKILSLIDSYCIKNLDNFLILCDDFSPQNVKCIDDKHCVVFPSNFTLTSSYVNVFLESGNVEMIKVDDI